MCRTDYIVPLFKIKTQSISLLLGSTVFFFSYQLFLHCKRKKKNKHIKITVVIGMFSENRDELKVEV